MRFRKTALVIISSFVLALGVSACGKKAEEQTTAATVTESADNATQPDGVFFTYNGTNIAMGAKWDDVKSGLGSEAKPSEKIEPCDGGDYIQIIHYYQGMEVTTLRDETVIGISLSNDSDGDVAVMGKAKKGDKTEDVKAALGDPVSEDEYSLNYEYGNYNLMIYIENGVVTGSMCMAAPE